MNRVQPTKVIVVDEVVPEAQAKIAEILAQHKPRFELTPEMKRDATFKTLREGPIENLND